VEQKGSDPFEVQVKQALDTIRNFLLNWNLIEDLNLDADVLNRLSTIIHLQGKWLKHRSSSLYVDPLLIELKIKMIDPKQWVNIFMKSWHPIVEMEEISSNRLKEVVQYWNQLQPIEERFKTLPASPPFELKSTTIDSLLKSKLLSGKPFNEVLETLWKNLKERTQKKGKLSYWSFISTDTYEETVLRAYLASFLITYGYAALEIDPVEEETFIIPYEEVKASQDNSRLVSIPLTINYETWKNGGVK
jgi:hypothetical protein